MPTTAKLWESLHTSYWFVPSLLAAASIGAAIGLLEVDSRVGGDLPLDGWWLYGGSAAGARAVLAAIVTSMISVTSVVFSITIVVLSLASGQFGPRLVRSFMRDRANHFVMGVFIATFIYALIILGAVESGDERGFVPRLSVQFGVLLVISSAGFLIFFIHHIALSIQADHVVAALGDEVRGVLERLYPARVDRSDVAARAGEPDLDLPHTVGVAAEQDGYIQTLRSDRLLEIARRDDLVIELEYRPGEWVVRGATLAVVASRAPIDGDLPEEVRQTFDFERHRSVAQDAEFGFRQITEVAVRALSPGINDPFTAMTCIDWLTALLRDLARRELPDRHCYDDEGRLRLIVHVPTFGHFVETSFGQIRQYAGGAPAVLGRLLQGVDTVLEGAVHPEQRHPLVHEARLVMLAAEGADIAPSDLADLRKRRAAVAATAARSLSG
ncbi:MAG TPA: DUF2254 domain-containing protein [Longimicrobiales bacterium]|nr:DUF2254 domain-containing protein [Longimicrobiales bacterium]